MPRLRPIKISPFFIFIFFLHSFGNIINTLSCPAKDKKQKREPFYKSKKKKKRQTKKQEKTQKQRKTEENGCFSISLWEVHSWIRGQGKILKPLSCLLLVLVIFEDTSKLKLMKLRYLGWHAEGCQRARCRPKHIQGKGSSCGQCCFQMVRLLFLCTSLLEFLGFLFLENFELLAQWLHRFKLYPADGALQQVQGQRSALLLNFHDLHDLHVRTVLVFVTGFSTPVLCAQLRINWVSLFYFVDEIYVLISRIWDLGFSM